MWFYGAIEQLLSGWVFELIPDGEADFDRARQMVVETICGGSTPARRRRDDLSSRGTHEQWRTTSSEDLSGQAWSPAGALASVRRATGPPAVIWMRVFKEDPPE